MEKHIEKILWTFSKQFQNVRCQVEEAETWDTYSSNSHLQMYKGQSYGESVQKFLSGANWVHKFLFDISFVTLFIWSSSLIDFSGKAHENNIARLLYVNNSLLCPLYLKISFAGYKTLAYISFPLILLPHFPMA